MSAGKLHPIFETALAPFAPKPRVELKLSEEIYDAIDGGEARVSVSNTSLTEWSAAAAKLELARDERDHMAGALKDLAQGATMLLDSGLWSGSALHYIKQVKAVAEAGLREGSVS